MPEQWLPWFQMASTVIAAIGIGISTWIGVSALNANRKDRREKISPNLLFTPGGETARIKLVGDRVFPGRDPHDSRIRTFLDGLPANSKRVVLCELVGELGNFGAGPAMNIRITFLPDRISTQEVWRELSAQERESFAFALDANETIPSPAHLAAGKTARLGVLPGAVCFLPSNSNAISGRFKIECSDAHGAPVSSLQEIKFEIVRDSGRKGARSLAITFGDRILPEESSPRRRFARWLDFPAPT